MLGRRTTSGQAAGPGARGTNLANDAAMPVSSLVVTLEGRSRDVLDELARDPRVTLGELQGCHLPVVLEAATLEESESVVEGLTRRPGILFVDVVTVDFSDVVAEPEESP
jgi:hypothetical protein